MLKFEKRQILENVGSSWSALAVNVMVGIFLSPFILHRLGDAAFGIWVLIFSVTDYYGLFDLGIRFHHSLRFQVHSHWRSRKSHAVRQHRPV
jgi:hypothetical protein